MFSGSQRLLTTNGYVVLEDVRQPVDAVCEFSVDGRREHTIQRATVTPFRDEIVANITTRGGRYILGDYASLWFLTEPKVHPKTKEVRGSWKRWQDCVADTERVTVSSQGMTEPITITEDDWLFYTYGYTDKDEATETLPMPQARREDQKQKPFVQRRMEWPEWYWYCTPAEKVLFLRGLYDAHGRTTKVRIYLGCATDRFSRELVIALSEFGVRASRFITDQWTWKKRPKEFIVDVRGGISIKRLSERICWYDEAMPSFRFAEIQRHAHRFAHVVDRPTGSPIVRHVANKGREVLYRVEVENVHTCTVNGLITRDSTQLV